LSSFQNIEPSLSIDLAIKKFSPHDDEEDDGKDFTMHVLYVNNGWAFDTYSSRQYHFYHYPSEKNKLILAT